MGDYRATVKLSLEAADLKFETEMWINYFDDGDGCDRRIVEWFSEHWEKCRDAYDKEAYEAQREYRERELRKTELSELQRLKAKYE